jgi:hypothetical protein
MSGERRPLSAIRALEPHPGSEEWELIHGLDGVIRNHHPMKRSERQMLFYFGSVFGLLAALLVAGALMGPDAPGTPASPPAPVLHPEFPHEPGHRLGPPLPEGIHHPWLGAADRPPGNLNELITTTCKYADRERLTYGVSLDQSTWYDTECTRDILYRFFEISFKDTPAYRRPDPAFVTSLNPRQLTTLVIGLDKIFAAPPESTDREAALMATVLLIAALRNPSTVDHPSPDGLTKAQADECGVESLRPWVAGYATDDTPAPLVVAYQCAKRVLGRDLSDAEIRLSWDSLQWALTHSKCGMPKPGECLFSMGRSIR